MGKKSMKTRYLRASPQKEVLSSLLLRLEDEKSAKIFGEDLAVVTISKFTDTVCPKRWVINANALLAAING